MPKAKDKFLGEWDLVPELCQYQDGHPPKKGHYKIDLEGKEVAFDLNWTDEHDKAHHVTYGGPVDGQPQPLNGGKMEVSFTRIDELRLDSSTFSNGLEASYVHRKASEDGALMIVVTTSNHANGEATQNIQIYRRA